MSTPRNVTITTIENELPGIGAYASRHNWKLKWNPDELKFIFEGVHPKDNTALWIIADVEGYRASPPSWSFEDPSGTHQGPSFFPVPGPVAGNGSIFHNSNIICAPFNRLAYREYKGPHGDWGGPANWLNAGNPSYVSATNISDMFAIIIGHLKQSKGMKK